MSGVVVGMRRGTQSATPIRWASAEADLRDLPLHLIHAWAEPVEVSVELGPQALPGLRRTATSTAVRGNPADVLLAQQPDILVLGSQPDSRHLSRLARTCLRQTACPVVIVPDTIPPSTGRVVVAVSHGETSRETLRWAADEARRRQARLVVIHAWQLRASSAQELLRPSRAVDAHRGEAHDQLHAWVADVLGDIDADMNAVHGGPLDVVLQAAADADLLVLGRGTHTVLGRLIYDTVGNDLSSLAPCPIAFIHQQPQTHRVPPT
jgi:nucleotide-binding universal stress UspA family protein